MNQHYLNLYTADQTRALDRMAIEEAGIAGYDLMKKAGASAFHAIMSRWPDARKLILFCGTGNNGGDGYVIATLAAKRDLAVQVYQLGNIDGQSGDAQRARKEMEAQGIIAERYVQQEIALEPGDVIVDALLGTGLEREVKNDWRNAIQTINHAHAGIERRVAAVDICSGLHADTGRILGESVKADLTITFIGRKQGLYTADGPEQSGDIAFDTLSVPEYIYQKIKPNSRCLPMQLSADLLKPRQKNSHKNSFGNLLFIGGAPGMSGAILLAATSALRCGAGLVTIVTHPAHATVLNISRPEIMSRGLEDARKLKSLISNTDVITIGPGLGTEKWGKNLLTAAIKLDKALIVDADGLNVLDHNHRFNGDVVLTPHPGEAARLLECSVAEIQRNRFDAAKKISEKYNAVCVLKGSGTIIYSSEGCFVCPVGNPGMATAGMGDVLSGIIGCLLSQGIRAGKSVTESVNNAVVLHGLAGDLAAEIEGEKGLLASDLFLFIRRLINDR